MALLQAWGPVAQPAERTVSAPTLQSRFHSDHVRLGVGAVPQMLLVSLCLFVFLATAVVGRGPLCFSKCPGSAAPAPAPHQRKGRKARSEGSESTPFFSVLRVPDTTSSPVDFNLLVASVMRSLWDAGKGPCLPLCGARPPAGRRARDVAPPSPLLNRHSPG